MDRVGMLGSRPARSAIGVWVSAVRCAVSKSLALPVRGMRALQRAFRVLFARILTAPQPTPLANSAFRFEVAPHHLKREGQSLGTHVLVELYGCATASLERMQSVERALVRAAHASCVKIVSHFFHEFEPYGVSGVVVIEESHYTIHTWPEHRYAAVDLFFCSDKVEPDRALEVLREAFQPEQMHVMKVQRGVLTTSPG